MNINDMKTDKKTSLYDQKQIGKEVLHSVNSKVLNKIFDKNIYILMQSRRYELELNGNKELFNIAQLEGFARQGNSEADTIVRNVSKEIDDLQEKYTSTQRYDEFEKYISELANITDKADRKRAILEDNKTKADKAWKEARSTANVSNSWMSEQKTIYLRAVEEYEDGCNTLYESTKRELEDLRNDLYIHLQLFYGPNTEMVDDSTVKLLKTDITMTSEELDCLAFKFRGNPTMLRIINEYATSKKIQSNLLIDYIREVKRNKEKILDIFDRFKDFCLQSVSKNRASRNAALKHLDRLGAEALQSFDDIVVKPM